MAVSNTNGCLLVFEIYLRILNNCIVTIGPTIENFYSVKWPTGVLLIITSDNMLNFFMCEGRPAAMVAS